jgi:hypothetical protein
MVTQRTEAVSYRFQYTGANDWRPGQLAFGAFPSGQINPYGEILKGAGRLIFHIEQEERPKAVEFLKSIFAKCHM